MKIILILAALVGLFFLYKKFIAKPSATSGTPATPVPVLGATRTVQFYGQGTFTVTYVGADGTTQTASVQGTGGTLCVKGGLDGVLNDGGAVTLNDIGAC